MKFKLLIFICLEAVLFGNYRAQTRFCERPTQLSGILSYSSQNNRYSTWRPYNTRGYTQGYPNTRGYTQGYPNTGGYTQGYPNTGGYTQGYPNTRGYTQGYPNTRGYTQGYYNSRGYTPRYDNTRGYDYTRDYDYTRRNDYTRDYYTLISDYDYTRKNDYTRDYDYTRRNDYTRDYDYTRRNDYTRDYDYTRRNDYTRDYDYTRRNDYTRDYDYTRRNDYTRDYFTRDYDYTRRNNYTRDYDYTRGNYYTRDYGHTDGYDIYDTKCWFFRTPDDHHVLLSVLNMNITDPSCESAYVEVEDSSRFRKTKICGREWTKWNYTAVGDVTITLKIRDYNRRSDGIFRMKYQIENDACTRNDSFRCSESHCIYPDEVCDGKIDCANGIDEEGCKIPPVKGIKASLYHGIDWLKNRQTDLGWGRNTHRAITALYLSGATNFRDSYIVEEMMVKELQFKTVIALLRNATSPLSVNELSMYVNALMLTCHDIRNFYGHDLLKILGTRALTSSSPSPGAYLTLCNADWTLPENTVLHLTRLLKRNSDYPFALDIQAMTVMALSCIRQRTKLSLNDVYNQTIEIFMENQKSDGSFGNAHTTAMVTQALISSGQADNKRWNYDGAVKYLMKNVNSSSVDFLSVYLSLPIFNRKTLLDIGSVDCSEFQRKFENDDSDVSEVIDTLGGNTSVQYSLYIGNNKEVVHTIYLKVPEHSTAFDVMKLAQIADNKYKFSFNRVQDQVYIYQIGGMSNDIEVGKFWLLYETDSDSKTLRKLYTKSPDEIMVKSGDHLIMWYKMADI